MSIAMAADSTQSELMQRRKHKDKFARQNKKQPVAGSSKSQKPKTKQVIVSFLLIFYCHLY